MMSEILDVPKDRKRPRTGMLAVLIALTLLLMLVAFGSFDGAEAVQSAGSTG
jgi:predicted nucleic acid-binding Zn ribbon protein